MAWFVLVIAGLCEVGFTTCLGMAKTTSGMTAKLWYGGFVASLALSMVLLGKATNVLPLGTAYAVWTGIGAVGTALVGIIVFHEPAQFWRVVFIGTLVASIIGLKVVSAAAR